MFSVQSGHTLRALVDLEINRSRRSTLCTFSCLKISLQYLCHKPCVLFYYDYIIRREITMRMLPINSGRVISRLPLYPIIMRQTINTISLLVDCNLGIHVHVDRRMGFQKSN